MLQKSYLKYELRKSFGKEGVFAFALGSMLTTSAGVIASPESDICLLGNGREALCGANELLRVWNVRTGALVNEFTDRAQEGATVTRIAPAADGLRFAVGYSNGTVRVWRLGSAAVLEATFTGHRKAVTALAWSSDDGLLATGSQGNEVVVWDVVAQQGRHRFKGHTGPITNLVFLHGTTWLASASKDTFVRIWELASQVCVQTLVGHRHEVWALAATESFLVTGSADNKLRFWVLPGGAEDVGQQQGEPLRYHGTVDRSTEVRVQTMVFTAAAQEVERRLVVQCAGKSVEVFRLHDTKTRQKRARRRLKREKEKLEKKEEKLRATVGVPGFDLEAELAKLHGVVVAPHRAADDCSLVFSGTRLWECAFCGCCSAFGTPAVGMVHFVGVALPHRRPVPSQCWAEGGAHVREVKQAASAARSHAAVDHQGYACPVPVRELSTGAVFYVCCCLSGTHWTTACVRELYTGAGVLYTLL